MVASHWHSPLVGLYSVVVFTAAQRAHEYGVRAALGATGAHLVRLTMERGLIPAMLGVLAGVVITIGSAKVVAALLFETSARDPVVLGTASVFLLAAAALASLVPGVRAAKADPMRALRAE